MAAEAAIYRAADEGDIEGVARMLDEDPRMLSSIWNGCALLMQAALAGRVPVVRLLLERGAGVNTAGANGYTALHFAAQQGHEEVMSMLLASGADPSMVNIRGWTALMIASLQGHVAVARLLLRSMGGCGLDQRNGNGWTALFYACVNGHADIVRSLLLAGADHTVATNNGWTPQQVAHERGHHECLALLQWWETELQRAYALHKARALHEDTNTRQQAPAAPVPAYLGPRAVPGSVMPCVEVGAPEQGGQGEKHDETASREEEVNAMVGFVVKDLGAELYIELLQGLHH